MSLRSLRADVGAASPLVVIATFVLVAAGITALAFFAFVDRTDEAFEVAVAADGSGLEVVRVVGEFRWGQLDLRFVDAGGYDQAGFLLREPEGRVSEGDKVAFASLPPAGPYVLEARLGGALVARSPVEI